MNKLGIKDNVLKLLERLGWVDMLKPMRGTSVMRWASQMGGSSTTLGIKI
ncbi:hypothetical protein MtrunA17_Chr3g0089561 [Medicago truncatula]|uniref:Uncharacterized protein n=1 Tax=Medicago truncatula TaxID=3880 RepID=A0A396IQV8_MEDTR|nr:hypothetical protein MtrunA17_Chr3g0089561 [Medicago truncatula]